MTNSKTQSKPGCAGIPVILDTDIGTDIDDTWALGMLLKCQELDLKLVTSATGDTEYRAKLISRMLEAVDRTDVGVGVGIRGDCALRHQLQRDWVSDYKLEDYPGKVSKDGVGSIIDTIMSSDEEMTLIAIGPLPNVAAALEREPRIAERARFVGMHGSIAWSPNTGNKSIPECNVVSDVASCRKVFAAPWDKTITPLDTCGRVRLTGAKYAAVAGSKDPVAQAVIENYSVWKKSGGWVKEEGRSSILFDCVAVYLAFSQELLTMRKMGISVTDDGFTVEDPGAPQINCAMEWKDLGAFEDLLVKRLTE